MPIQNFLLSKIGLTIVTALFVVLAAPARAREPVPPTYQNWYGPYHSITRNSQTLPSRTLPATLALTDWIVFWNSIAIDATGLDHTPILPGKNRIFGHQLGPGRSSRAMAIVHIAMFDALNAITGEFKSYSGLAFVSGNVSSHAALSQAAHDTLVAMFPSQAPQFATVLTQSLSRIQNQTARNAGVALGRLAASEILKRSNSDGSIREDPGVNVSGGYKTSDQPGHWRPDPISQVPLAVGAHWGKVKPFVIKKVKDFRISPPPELNSAEYAQAFAEVQNLGGDGIITPTSRTAEQTFIGIFWAYDGTPSLCAPPRLYNQIAVTIAAQQAVSAMQLVRLLALVNVAMADAGVVSWESKYHYDFWRPIAGIRESDVGTGPSGKGDGNSATQGDAAFMPLGAPASNLNGPNFTPPFPSYPSGHATFGGALFQTLRRFFQTDQIAFTFVSDEFNGITRDNQGNVRPLRPRSFTSLSQAEEENGQSRIYLGIHWAFDKTEGLTQGERVADVVFDEEFVPLR